MSLDFLNVTDFSKGLTPITSSQLFTRTEEFHPEGLFSELIFGHIGSLDRKRKFSFINLNSKVIHPTGFKILIRLDRKIEKYLSTEKSFFVDKEGNIVEDENGSAGIDEFIRLFPKIKFRGDTEDRAKFINFIEKSYKENTLFIDKIPVIPPDQRPTFKDEGGIDMTNPLNNYYLTIIRRSNQIKSIGGKGPFFDLLNWGMQKAVIDHDNFIRTKVGKKFGLIRSQLLGKRVDFSGRAVITSGPQFKSDQVGLPFKLALSLFEPFIVHVLLYSGKINKKELETEVKSFTGVELSTSSVSIVFRSLKGGDVVPEKLYNLFFEAAELASSNRVILAKRDPVLHPESVRAFYPVIIKGNTIQLSTLITGGFNADFDGDTMAVFHPITNEAQEEAKKRMMMARSSNSSTSVTFELSKEMCVGLYLLTKDVKRTTPAVAVSEEILDLAKDPYIPVTYKTQKTTMGKAIVNSCFPKDFRFVNDLITKKIVKKIIFEIIQQYGDSIGAEVANKLKNKAFKFATIMSPSLILDEITIPPEIYEMKKDLDKASTEEATIILDKMKAIMIAHLKNTGLYDLVDSGSTKGWDQPIQILVAKGIMVDPTGKILPPIKGSLSDGLTPIEYFNASYGARAGIIDRVLNTADTGYTSRKLAFLLNSVELDWHLKDCKTNLTLDLKLDEDIIFRLKGRYVLKGGKVIEFNDKDFKVGDVIHLRTPIFCKSPKICHTCYGKLLEIHKSPYVGIIAAQTIGERGTQLIMRSFHSTAIKIIKRDFLKDICDNDPMTSEEQLKKYIQQQDETIFCLKSCKITIDLESYDVGDNLLIKEEEGILWVNNLISTMEFDDLTIDFILDFPIELQIYKMTHNKKQNIILEYKENDKLLDVPLQRQNVKEQVLYVGRLLGGQERFKDVNHLFLKLFKVYGGDISDMDLVHLEILLSQTLRDKNNPVLPARLGKDPEHPILKNIKRNIFNSGIIQGLAFENIGEAINTGLISETELPPSILEKLLTGDLVEKKKKED